MLHGTLICGPSYRGLSYESAQAAACKDPEAVPEPDAFKLGRPDEAYIHFGYGPHECLGREIALTGIVALVWACAGLKNLRPAPGEMGVLKAIQTETGKQYLNDNWSYVNVDPSSKASPAFQRDELSANVTT